MAAYLGEIRLFALPFVPNGWVPCNGALYDNLVYPDLANLLKNAFGGEPGLTFAVPDLRGRVPVGVGTDNFGFSYQFAQTGGQISVSLLETQIPAHAHGLAMSSTAGTQSGRAVVAASITYEANSRYPSDGFAGCWASIDRRSVRCREGQTTSRR